LAFCRLAIAAHGGTITADGNPGQGTTFTIRLPINS
jgi:signal transduction histidine kinase